MVLVGLKVSLEPGALYRLLDADIAVLVCDWKGVPVGSCLPHFSHGRVGARHQAQAAMSAPRRKNAWARVVRTKIHNQAMALASLHRPGADHLFQLSKRVRSGDPSNVEA